MGGALEKRFDRVERVGEAVNMWFWAANRAKKKKNREGDRASDFDGSCWMGGHNNQPKSGLSLEYTWERLRAGRWR